MVCYAVENDLTAVDKNRGQISEVGRDGRQSFTGEIAKQSASSKLPTLLRAE